MEALSVIVFLSLPCFFLWRGLAGRWIKQPVARNIAAGLTTILATPLVYAALVACWVAIASYYPKQEFDRTKWLADKEKRYEMSKDIIDTKLLIGKSKSEVKQLLGEEGSNSNANDDWSYYLGYVPAIFGIDYDVLDIYFEDGKVVRVAQHQS
jgi:hypothetical protein